MLHRYFEFETCLSKTKNKDLSEDKIVKRKTNDAQVHLKKFRNELQTLTNELIFKKFEDEINAVN